MSDFVDEELACRGEAGLLRRLRRVDSAQDTWLTIDGRRVLLMCSNNYLGLANHPALAAAAVQAAAEWGVGSGASRLISGSMRLHHQLEDELSALKGSEAALLFSSGYQANLGAITTLVRNGDAVFSDELNHASIIDGCRLSHAKVVVYPHRDMAVLEERLRHTRARRRLIVTDSIFSMDGDAAPLAQICDLAERYEAMVMVDEAHATGVLGAHGGGLVEALGLQPRVTVQMGTLGKGLGSFGAFVTARRAVIDLLINTARSFIYTTALPPPVVAATLAALEIVRREPERRTRLHANAVTLQNGLRRLGLHVGSEASHIIPILIGDAEETMRLSEALLADGVFVQGIRPPTVAAGTSRLRATVMSTHSDEDLQVALVSFERAFAARVSDQPEPGRHP